MQPVVRNLDGKTEADWAEVATRLGYADQPHLSDKFRELASVMPGQYLRSRVDGPNLRTRPPHSPESSSSLRSSLEWVGCTQTDILRVRVQESASGSP
jgi:AraC-like DNA-binding protein